MIPGGCICRTVKWKSSSSIASYFHPGRLHCFRLEQCLILTGTKWILQKATNPSLSSIQVALSSNFVRDLTSLKIDRDKKKQTHLLCTLDLQFRGLSDQERIKLLVVRRELQVHRDRVVANYSSWAGLACNQKHKCGMALLHLVRILVTGRFSGTICETVWWVGVGGTSRH